MTHAEAKETIELSAKNMRGLRRVAKYTGYDDMNDVVEILLESYLDD